MMEGAMALDVAIVGDNGEPETIVPIRVNEHARLLAVVHDATLPLLWRLRDYYEDTEYEPQELDALMAELASLIARVRGDEELTRIAADLVHLVNSAKRSGRPVVAIAD
jgi:hypothetical protein